MGKLRTTVCSPTIGKQGHRLSNSTLQLISRVSAAHFHSLCWRNVSGEDNVQESNTKCHDSRIAFINHTNGTIPDIHFFPGVQWNGPKLPTFILVSQPIVCHTRSSGLRHLTGRVGIKQKKRSIFNVEKTFIIFNIRIKQKRKDC